MYPIFAMARGIPAAGAADACDVGCPATIPSAESGLCGDSHLLSSERVTTVPAGYSCWKVSPSSSWKVTVKTVPSGASSALLNTTW